jgi:hypothetical protein
MAASAAEPPSFNILAAAAVAFGIGGNDGERAARGRLLSRGRQGPVERQQDGGLSGLCQDRSGNARAPTIGADFRALFHVSSPRQSMVLRKLCDADIANINVTETLVSYRAGS